MSPQGFGPETKTQQGIIGTPASSTKCGALAAIGNRKKNIDFCEHGLQGTF